MSDAGGPPIPSTALSLWPVVPADAEYEHEDVPTPTCWPQVCADNAGEEWEALQAWVEELKHRFHHLDHHVIPSCWLQHNEHVEALVALRDQERMSFSDNAPATAPIDWFRALRDITALMRSWTSELPCGTTHAER